MGLFSKKYDCEKDRVFFEFDPTTESFYPIIAGNRIEESTLNHRSQQILKKKNDELRTVPGLLEQYRSSYRERDRFRELKDMGYACNSFEYLGPVEGSISPDLEPFLNELTSEDHVLLGVHRVGSFATQDDIQDILNNGLIMTGHMIGTDQRKTELSHNVSYYPDNRKVIKELMYADQYKGSVGALLVKIPDSDLRGNIFITDNNGNLRLNPKYNVGFVPSNKEHRIEQLIRPQEKTLSPEEEKVADELLRQYMNGQPKTDSKDKVL